MLCRFNYRVGSTSRAGRSQPLARQMIVKGIDDDFPLRRQLGQVGERHSASQADNGGNVAACFCGDVKIQKLESLALDLGSRSVQHPNTPMI